MASYETAKAVTAKTADKSPNGFAVAGGIAVGTLGLIYASFGLVDVASDPEAIARYEAKQQLQKREQVEQGLIKRCATDLQASLKAPDSYRQEGAYAVTSGDGERVTVSIKYSAINSFNARLTNYKTCNYVL